jgi:hypothetical protein
LNVCLVIAFQNEAPWLALHLPVVMQASRLGGLIGLDGGSQDGSAALVEQLGGQVVARSFDWHFGAHMNTLIEQAEAAGYDAAIRLDPDECMFPEHLDAVIDLLETYKAVRLPRLNFEVDRVHYCPVLYPDWQLRGWRLHAGVRYTGRVHETLEPRMAQARWVEAHNQTGERKRDIVAAPHLPIFHYEGLKDGALRQLKGLNYHRTAQGLPPLPSLPAQTPPFVPRWHIPYTGPQPVDPEAVGLRAPVTIQSSFPPGPSHVQMTATGPSAGYPLAQPSRRKKGKR